MCELAVAAVDVAPALEQLQDRPALCWGDGVHRRAARSVVVEAARASAVLPAAAPAAVELQHGAGASCSPARLDGAVDEVQQSRFGCFVTDRDDLDTKAADAYHRGHATVELAIRDLKEGSGLSRCPSGRFFANGAWLACCVLAHNLVRWTARLGGAHPPRQLTVAATIRNRLLTVPGRLVNHSGRRKLRLPSQWPWATAFTNALQRIRNLPLLI